VSNRPNHNQQIVQAQAQPIINLIIAEFARKVAEHQRLVQRRKSITTFRTILAHRLRGLDQLFIKKQPPRIVTIRKAELAATLNEWAIWGVIREVENTITRGGIRNDTPYKKTAGLLRLKAWCNCNTPSLTISFAHRQNPFPRNRWQPQINRNRNPIPNLRWEIECIECEILGADRTTHNFTDDKVKHNAAHRVIQATLMELDNNLNLLV
jgi:hypothetical protein